jgi:hypothetical protein
MSHLSQSLHTDGQLLLCSYSSLTGKDAAVVDVDERSGQDNGHHLGVNLPDIPLAPIHDYQAAYCGGRVLAYSVAVWNIFGLTPRIVGLGCGGSGYERTMKKDQGFMELHAANVVSVSFCSMTLWKLDFLNIVHTRHLLKQDHRGQMRPVLGHIRVHSYRSRKAIPPMQKLSSSAFDKETRVRAGAPASSVPNHSMSLWG